MKQHHESSGGAGRIAPRGQWTRTPEQIVTALLEGDHYVEQILGEASVHRSRRSAIWQASFTGPFGGQVWKSTGTDDYATAIAIAKKLELAARAQRARAGRTDNQPSLRTRQSPGGTGGLTQREVAAVLRISERAVRVIEKRALRKLAQHAELRELLRQYLTGELSEEVQRLSGPEIQALLGLTRSPAERDALLKVLQLVLNQSRTGILMYGTKSR